MYPATQKILLRLVYLILLMPFGCVEPIEQNLWQDVNVVVVDGGVTNLAEPQLIWLNRSKSDPITGRFGSYPLTEATVEVVVDSSQVVVFQETTPGRYLAPERFRGQVGHNYQLRFTLSDGTKYQSQPEVMQAVPAIDRVYEEFNPNSLTGKQRLVDYYTSANDFYVDFQDPEGQPNYYKWDWKLWERQEWCSTCIQGFYFIKNPFDTTQIYEGCVSGEKFNIKGYFVNDYRCRTACWEIIQNRELNLFDDQLSNGGSVRKLRVAQIPYYQPYGSLVEIRQTSLTQKAYAFYRLQQQQSQNVGGVADAPPTALVGNVQNVANSRETVVGYFTASAVASVRYWLDRKQNTGYTPGLFLALNGLSPSPEDEVDPETGNTKYAPTYRLTPLAPCIESDTRTPKMPAGWRE